MNTPDTLDLYPGVYAAFLCSQQQTLSPRDNNQISYWADRGEHPRMVWEFREELNFAGFYRVSLIPVYLALSEAYVKITFH